LETESAGGELNLLLPADDVASVTDALIKVQPLLSAQPGPGVPFFAAVVILTMLAATSFDSRLIWDRAA